MSSLNGAVSAIEAAAAANSAARMEAFECPICAPKRYFVTEIGLRTHVADRHPWRSLPPQGGGGGGGAGHRGIAPSRPALPEPAWLRERQAEAATAAAGFHRPLLPPRGESPSPPRSSNLRHRNSGAGIVVYGNYNGNHGNRNHHNNHNNHGNLGVTFDTQSQLSDDVFVDDGGGGVGGNVNSRARYQQYHQHQSRQQQYRHYEQQRQLHAQPLAYESSAAAAAAAAAAATARRPQPPPEDEDDDNEYPPPDYDATPSEIDALDSSPRKRRDLATARRPWYDSDEYAGPRNLMEQPGGYYDDEVNNGQASSSRRRMRREMEDRDSRIETLRLEIDRLWDERMRLLQQEAARTRVVREQQVLASALPLGESEEPPGALSRRGFQEESLGMMTHRHPAEGRHRQGHAFQPILPHSRLQLYRQQQRQPQHRYPADRRAIDY